MFCEDKSGESETPFEDILSEMYVNPQTEVIFKLNERIHPDERQHTVSVPSANWLVETARGGNTDIHRDIIHAHQLLSSVFEPAIQSALQYGEG